MLLVVDDYSKRNKSTLKFRVFKNIHDFAKMTKKKRLSVINFFRRICLRFFEFNFIKYFLVFMRSNLSKEIIHTIDVIN